MNTEELRLRALELARSFSNSKTTGLIETDEETLKRAKKYEHFLRTGKVLGDEDER
jgi:hypothetical protein